MIAAIMIGSNLLIVSLRARLEMGRRFVQAAKTGLASHGLCLAKACQA